MSRIRNHISTGRSVRGRLTPAQLRAKASTDQDGTVHVTHEWQMIQVQVLRVPAPPGTHPVREVPRVVASSPGRSRHHHTRHTRTLSSRR